MSALDKKQESFKSGLKKIKASLQRQQWKEVLIFCGFVLFSFSTWMLQSLQQDYEIEISIPIKLKNIPADIYISSPEVEVIKVKIRDKGTVLMNYSFGRRFAPIEINFKKQNNLIDPNQSSVIIDRKDLESDIQKQLITTTTLLEFTPDQIELQYSKRAQKELPVSFDGTIAFEPGFQLSGEVSITPPTVIAYASEAVLDSIQEIKTVFTEIKKVRTSVSRVIKLQTTGGVVVEPNEVTISAPVDEFVEKSFEIAVECSDIPQNYKVRLLPNMVKISTNIPMTRFRDLTSDQFVIRIPFAVLENNLSGILPIELTEKPDWINNVTLSPDRIEFIIEQDRVDAN